MIKNTIKLNKTDLSKLVQECVKKVLKENDTNIKSNVIKEAMADNYSELMPLHDLFTVGYEFKHYDRDNILTMPLCDKNGKEIGYSLNDLCFQFDY